MGGRSQRVNMFSQVRRLEQKNILMKLTKNVSQTVSRDDCVVYGSGDWRNYHADCLQQNGNDDFCRHKEVQCRKLSPLHLF